MEKGKGLEPKESLEIIIIKNKRIENWHEFFDIFILKNEIENWKTLTSQRNNHEIFNFCSVVLLARNFYSLNEKPIDDFDEDDSYLEDNEICEEDNLYFEGKLGGKNKRKEKIVVDDFGKKIKIVKEIKVKNGVLYCDIFKEKI